MTTHVYVADRASGFNFTVVFKEGKKGKETRVRVRFEKGQFKTDDDKLAAAIDDLLANNVGIRRNCRKADKAAALKLALAHKARMEHTGAHKGSVTAEASKQAMTTALAERDAELRPKNVDTQAFADEGLMLSEEVPHPPVPPAPTEDEKPKVNLLGGGS